MLVYLFEDGDVPYIASGKLSKKEVFNYIKDIKYSLTPEKLCGVAKDHRSKVLLEFVSEIFSYSYTSKPNYAKLKMMLIKCL